MKKNEEVLSNNFKIKDFKLFDPVSKSNKSINNLISDIATVIMFICNHCPYVKHINKKLVSISNYYIPKGVSFIAVNSNDYKNFPEDSPDNMLNVIIKEDYPFPYLFDDSQDMAKAYKVYCTPDFYVFNKYNYLFYHGQLDDSRPNNNIPITGIDLKNALNYILYNNNNKKNIVQKPSTGCSIKWKK